MEQIMGALEDLLTKLKSTLTTDEAKKEFLKTLMSVEPQYKENPLPEESTPEEVSQRAEELGIPTNIEPTSFMGASTPSFSSATSGTLKKLLMDLWKNPSKAANDTVGMLRNAISKGEVSKAQIDPLVDKISGRVLVTEDVAKSLPLESKARLLSGKVSRQSLEKEFARLRELYGKDAEPLISNLKDKFKVNGI
jgi:hypothetical protein